NRTDRDRDVIEKMQWLPADFGCLPYGLRPEHRAGDIDKYIGIQRFHLDDVWVNSRLGRFMGVLDPWPVHPYAAIPEFSILTASEAFPVRTNRRPWLSIPSAFHSTAPFSTAKATSSSARADAAAQFPHRIRTHGPAPPSANKKVAAWPISRAS